MSGYIGSTPVPQATQHRESFTATEGQTSFATAGYTPQFVDVYLNGSHLSPADFTATNGSDVVLGVAASADDVCDIISYSPFEVADATFTGTTNLDIVDIDGTLNASGLSYVNSGNGSGVALKIGGEGGGGLKTQYILASGHTNYQIGVATHAASVFSITPSTSAGNTTFSNPALNINASGNVGIGTTTPVAKIHSTSSQEQLTLSEGNARGATFDYRSSTGNLNISTNGANARSAPQLTLALNGNVTVQDGNLVVGTNGHGIDFTANTTDASDTSELLDDYEEGTFTPALTDNSGRAGTGATQVGIYVKVGDLVHIQGRVSISSLASMNGVVNLTGMPFTSNSTSNSHASLNFGQASGLNISAGVSLCGIFSTNSTACEVQAFDVTTGSTGLTHTELSADGNMIFSGTYRAN